MKNQFFLSHRRPLIIGICLFLLLTGVFFGYLSWQSKKIPPAPTPPPSAGCTGDADCSTGYECKSGICTEKEIIPPPSAGDETANWKTYQDTDYGFEIKYPSNWTTFEETPKTSVMGINIPTLKVTLSSPREGGNDIFQEHIVILASFLPIKASLNQASDFTLDQVKTVVKDLTIIASIDTTFLNLPARKVIITGKINEVNVKESLIFILNGNKSYAIICAAEATKYQNYLNIFNKIIETFKLI